MSLVKSVRRGFGFSEAGKGEGKAQERRGKVGKNG